MNSVAIVHQNNKRQHQFQKTIFGVSIFRVNVWLEMPHSISNPLSEHSILRVVEE